MTINLLGIGSFFGGLRDQIKPKQPPPPSPPTIETKEIPELNYERPEGIHAAPDGTGKIVAITFDDGPSGDVTTHILDTLQVVGGRATFFCIGQRAKHYEETLRRMVREGHEIASHSWSHERLTRLNNQRLEQDLAKTARALEEYSGMESKFLRPPYGATSERMLRCTDMPVILWSIDSEDWRYCDQLCKKRSKEQRELDFQNVVNSVLDYVRDGDIILMHDLYTFTQDVADAIIFELHHQGWELVTVSELFAARGIELQPGKKYYSARS